MKGVMCMAHPAVEAAHQLTLYDRRVKDEHGGPTAIWRGYSCDECIESARTMLKKNGPTHLLLIWGVK